MSRTGDQPVTPRPTDRPGPLTDRIVKAQPPPNPLAAPEFAELRELRSKLKRGGLPLERTPEDGARIAAFTVVSDLLLILEEYRGRVQRGEPVRLVVMEALGEAGVVRLEIIIETIESSERPCS